MSQNTAAPPRRFRAQDAPRRLPTFAEIIAPRTLLQFFLGMLECWFFSREFARLTLGIPFLVLILLPIGTYFWTRGTPVTTLLARYDKVRETAAEKQDANLEETALLAMTGLLPADYSHRLRLARFYVAQGRAEEGYAEFSALAPDGGGGSAEARLWIVEQALSEKPIRQLTAVEVERQLRFVLESQPNNSVAHGLLATEYLKRQEFLLAEQHLAEVIKVKPERSLELAQLKIRLDKPKAEVAAAVAQAVTDLTQLQKTNPEDTTIVAKLVQALMLQSEFDKALATLQAAQKSFPDNQDLKKLRAELIVFEVERSMSESYLNRDSAVLQTFLALQQDPANARAVDILLGLKNIGAVVPLDQLQAPLKHWTEAVKREPANTNSGLTLARLQILHGQTAQAAETIRPIVLQQPQLRLGLAELLQKAGATTEADELIQTAIAEADGRRQQDPENLEYWIQQADALFLLEKPEAVRELVKPFLPAGFQAQSDRDRLLIDLNARACLLIFDSLLNYRSSELAAMNSKDDLQFRDAPAEQVLLLLEDAGKSPGRALAALERLCVLSLSSHQAAPTAEARVLQLRSEGERGVMALKLRSAYAVAIQEYAIAIPMLEQATVVSRNLDPMILNNLAVALIRSTPPNAARALDQINQAIRLVPENSDILTTRGEIMVAMELWKEAQQDLTRALELRSSNFESHQLLDRTYQALGDQTKAEYHRQQALDILAARTTSATP